MKVIEILKLNRELLKFCCDAGIRLDDIRYIDLFNDYNRLLADGGKPPISWLRWPRNTVYASEKYMTLSADSKPTAISLQWNEIAPEWNKHMCTIPLPAINDTP